MTKKRVLIAGAAGRDFHNFNLVYRGQEEYEVVAFTATQIPNIEGRVYPSELAGDLYPDGIPIAPENELEELIGRHEVDEVVFAYSDVTHEHALHLGSPALAAGAAPGLARARGRRVVPADLAARDDAGLVEAGRRGLRRAHRLWEEPDDAS